MSKYRMPEDWLNESKTIEASVNKSGFPADWNSDSVEITAGTEITAAGQRLVTDMSADVIDNGLCPVTKQPMIPMVANGHKCLVSMDAMVCLPVKNEQ